MYRRPLTIAEAADLPLSMCALTITAEIGTNKESFQMQYITAKAMRRGARTRVNLLDGDKTRLQVQRFRVGAPQPAPRAPWFSFRPFESNYQFRRQSRCLRPASGGARSPCEALSHHSCVGANLSVKTLSRTPSRFA